MLLEIILALIIGVSAGTLTGLTPGVHINLIASLITTSAFLIEKFSPEIIITFIAAMAITHTFIDFIPTVYLGAPDEDTFLAVMPSHILLLKGRAHEAVMFSLYGSITGLVIILVCTPIFILASPTLFALTQKAIPFILILVSLYTLARDKTPLQSSLIFFLAGILGFTTTTLPLKEPLLPLLSGLFGASALITSIRKKTIIPKQKIKPLKEILFTKKEISKTIIGSIISAPICSFLPGIGSGHAAFLSSEIINFTKKVYISLTGAINTIIMGLSFVALYSIQRTRSGAAAAIDKIIPELSLANLILIISIVLFSGVIASFITVSLSKKAAFFMSKVNYSYLSITVLIILSVIVTLITGYIGLIVFISATALGIYTINSNIRRITLMGSLLIPTILFYLF